MKKILTAVLCLLCLFGTAKPVTAQEGVQRISGPGRYETAVEVSKASLKKTDVVVLVNGERFVDALPGSTLANLYKAPILLCRTDKLPDVTAAEIMRLGAKRAFVLGGPLAVSEAVVASLRETGVVVERIGGRNRYETSEQIYKKIAALVDVKEVLLAATEADSVASSGYRKNIVPLILVDPANPSDYVSGISAKKTVLGGTLVVPESAYRALGATERIGGKNRFETAIALAKKTPQTDVILVNSHTFIDALTAGTLAYSKNADVLLTPAKELNAQTASYLRTQNPANIYAVGGELALSSSVLKAAVISKDETDFRSGDKSRFGYWNYLNNYDTSLRMTPEQVAAYNARNIATAPSMNDVLTLDSLTDAQVRQRIQSLSAVPSATRYTSAYGTLYTRSMYDSLRRNANISNAKNMGRFAVVVKRSALRTFPSTMESHRKGGSVDYFTETTFYPWEELAVHHSSADGKWYFVSNYHYSGWIAADAVAFVPDAQAMTRYTRSKDFLVVLDRQTNLKSVTYDMGSRIPLKAVTEKAYSIFLPSRDKQGNLAVETVDVAKSDTFHVGYLPYTTANVIRQVLKFYGEVYGWGGANNARDCSGIIVDSYRTVGILIPRNSYQQERNAVGERVNLSKISGLSAKVAALGKMRSGTGLYMPGHAMMVLGKDADGVTKIIHQYSGHYENGKYIRRNRCDITPATIRSSGGKTFLELCNTAVDFID